MAHDFNTPDSRIAEICDQAMDLIDEQVELAGGEVERIFLAVTVEGLDPDACTCGRYFEDPGELIAWMILHAQKAGERLGLPIQVHTIGRG